jgi:PEP-CTERM motif
MQKLLVRALALMSFAGALVVPSQAPAGWVVGGTIAVSVTDSPLATNFTQNVTLGDGTTILDQGELTLTQTIIPAGPGAQWLVLDFEATGAQLLAGDPNADWEIDATAPVSSPGQISAWFCDWSVNGTLFNATDPIGGFFAQPNPLGSDPANVFGWPGEPWPVTTSFDSLAGLSPYSYLTAGGLDPGAVNGFVMGSLLTPASVPEPSSLALAAIGAMAVGGLALRHRRERRLAPP